MHLTEAGGVVLAPTVSGGSHEAAASPRGMRLRFSTRILILGARVLGLQVLRTSRTLRTANGQKKKAKNYPLAEK